MIEMHFTGFHVMHVIGSHQAVAANNFECEEQFLDYRQETLPCLKP